MRTLSLVALLALGCEGGQTGEDNIRCEAVGSDPLGPQEQAPNGVSPEDVLAKASGTHTATLTWAIGGTTGLTVEVTPDGTADYVHYEYRDDGSGLAAELGCDDQVELGASFTFQTADGGFDEAFDGTLEAPGTGDVTVWHELDLAALGGTYAVTTEYDTTTLSNPQAWIQLAFGDGTWSGSVDGQASGEDGDTAFAEAFDVAEWVE